MFQIIYECSEPWPEEGSLRVEIPQFRAEISVSPDSARRRANGYLGRYVAMALRSDNSMLVLGGERPVWRMSIDLYRRKLGKVATLGTIFEINVDALTREVIPLSAEKIESIHTRANDIISRLT